MISFNTPPQEQLLPRLQVIVYSLVAFALLLLIYDQYRQGLYSLVLANAISIPAFLFSAAYIYINRDRDSFLWVNYPLVAALAGLALVQLPRYPDLMIHYLFAMPMFTYFCLPMQHATVVNILVAGAMGVEIGQRQPLHPREERVPQVVLEVAGRPDDDPPDKKAKGPAHEREAQQQARVEPELATGHVRRQIVDGVAQDPGPCQRQCGGQDETQQTDRELAAKSEHMGNELGERGHGSGRRQESGGSGWATPLSRSARPRSSRLPAVRLQLGKSERS